MRPEIKASLTIIIAFFLFFTCVQAALHRPDLWRTELVLVPELLPETWSWLNIATPGAVISAVCLAIGSVVGPLCYAAQYIYEELLTD